MYQFTYFDTVILFIVFVYATYKFFTIKYNYWKDRNVVYVKPKFLFGSQKDFMMGKKTLGEVFQDYYREYPDEKYIGLFRLRDPILMIKDPELMKYVFIKNFNCFQNRNEDHSEEKEILTRNMFTSTAVYWKKSRQLLTPAFTSGKLRNMFYLIIEKAEELRKYLDITVTNNKECEVREFMARYTTEVIGSCVFGLKLGSMMETEDEFRKMGRKIFTMNTTKILKSFARAISPTIFYGVGLRVISKEEENFFSSIVKKIVEERQKTPGKRNDFIDLLLEIKKNDDEKDPLVDDAFMAAQSFIFFAAGFETSSTLMATLLYELGVNQYIQEKLVAEISSVLKKNSDQLTYESISKMEYLEMIMEETMRKYPALGVIQRTCTSSHKFPEKDFIVEKGLKITIPVLSIHYDPKYYPDPEKFIPERFSAEAKKNRHPMVYLPFGEGPRNCIGTFM